MLSVLIVDDEPLARNRLSKLIEDMADYVKCGEAENGTEAIEKSLALSPDIVLMDIRMPEKDGLEAAKAIGQMKPSPALIFCTAYDEHAIEAFKLNAIDYLLKPVRQKDLEAALARSSIVTQSQLKAIMGVNPADNKQMIVANTWKGKEIIPLEEVLYVLAEDKCLKIVHDQGTAISDQTLKELEQEFEPMLTRAHRGALVNLKKIQTISRDASGHHTIHLKGTPDTISVSRRVYATLIDNLEKHL